MEIIGVGLDATEIDRIAATIARYGDRFLTRIFTEGEVAYCRRKRDAASSFAARFAAKEAAMKALGTGWRRGVTWRDFEVFNAPSGKPCMRLSGKASEICSRLGGGNVLLSLTHSGDYALAQVIVEGVSREERSEAK